MLIPGITAQRQVPTGGLAPVAVLDFVNGTYMVDSVSYAPADLLEDQSPSIGQVFDPAAIVPGRGMLVTNDNENAPRAKGPLLAKLLAPFTAVLEWEDFSESTGDVLVYVDTSPQMARIYASPDTGQFRMVAVSGYSDVETGYATRWSGVNRLAVTLGNAASNISINTRAALKNPSVDSTGILSVRTWSDVAPFGSWISSSGDPLDGFARRLEIYPPQADAAVLLGLSDVSAFPGRIGEGRAAEDEIFTASVTSTTITIDFAPAPRATGYEYWIEASERFASPRSDAHDWHPLPGDMTITGLSPETTYVVYVRAINARGPGPCAGYITDDYPTTAA